VIDNNQAVVAKIRSMGYWRVVIRPPESEYQKDRVANILDLPRIIERSKVSLRGWDFPHIDRQSEIAIGSTFVDQAIDWEGYVEYWRFYQSGQFLHLDGLKEDWMGEAKMFPDPQPLQPGTRLGVSSAMFRFTEIFEFASRLALTPAGSKTLVIQIDLNGLAGRSLWVDSPNHRRFSHQHTASVNTFQHEQEYRTEDLASTAWDLALPPAIELYRRFGWDVTLGMVRDLQLELKKPHYSGA